jgi:hypothetical protein
VVTRHQNSSGTDATNAVVDAWQAALAAEQQAAFGYALLGPRLPTSQQQLAYAAQLAHEATRDATAVAIARAGTTPQAPAGDYPALYPRASSPRTLAAELEDYCAAAWRFLYAQAATVKADTAVRTQAQSALIASAVRATHWRKLSGAVPAVRAFPGL